MMKQGVRSKVFCICTEYRTGYNEAKCAKQTSVSLAIMKQGVRNKLLCISTEYRTGYDLMSPQQDSLSAK
jgi:hypothetical protein